MERAGKKYYASIILKKSQEPNINPDSYRDQINQKKRNQVHLQKFYVEFYLELEI